MKVLVPGHIGKMPKDTGTVSPAGWAEASFVAGVCAIVARCWGEKQLAFSLDANGPYAERGKRADAQKAELVVHVHADAVAAEVGPDISSVFYWPGSAVGKLAAQRVVAALEPVVPWPVRLIEATDKPWLTNVRALLKSSKAPAIVIELGFADGALGRTWLLGNRESLGKTLAAALEASCG